MKPILASLLFALLPLAAADLAGTWNVSTRNGNGDPMKSQLILKEESGALTGYLLTGDRKLPLPKLDRKGDQITFQIPYEEIMVSVRLKLDGGALKGEWTVDSGETAPVTAERAAASPVAGKWKLAATTPDGNEMKVDLDLKDDGGKLSGTLTIPDGTTLPISEAKLEGGALSFKLNTDQGAFILKLNLDGAKGKGTYQTPDGATGPVVASR
jgi:hypothetical protein